MISSSAVTACMEKRKYFQAKVKSNINVRKNCLTLWPDSSTAVWYDVNIGTFFPQYLTGKQDKLHHVLFSSVTFKVSFCFLSFFFSVVVYTKSVK